MATDPNLYPSNSLNNPSIGPSGVASTSPLNPTTQKVKPVAQGSISQAKPSLGKKLKDTFIASDVTDVRDYVIFDVLVPSFRNMLVMGLVSTIYAFFFGKGARGGQGVYGGMGYGINPYSALANRPMYGVPNQYTSYGNMTIGAGIKANSKQNGMPVNPYNTMVQPSMVRLQTRGDAELVRDQLTEIMQTFSRVTVADFFDTAGMPGNGPIDMNYGWTDLTGMHVESYNDGFGISMPKARPLA